MRAALSHEFKVAIPAYDEKPRTKWIFDYSVQNTIMVSRTFFTQDVNEAFEELEEGNEDALKVSLVIELQLALPCLGARVHGPAVLLDFQGNAVSELDRCFDLGKEIRIWTPTAFQRLNGAYKLLCCQLKGRLFVADTHGLTVMQGIFDKQVSQLADLITIINGELTKNDRKKLITLCTIDVHARDVVQRLIEERVENQSCFQWQSQLRYYQNEKSKEAQVNICDAEIKYTYEYIGNCGCLCITPLTDRCYITLTQAQRLVLGGAPAGPAG